ncbi:uncharacterized protein PV07_01741 [Cladophialophora immunda]|uniref:Cytochrome P450 oxidoreductase n=1 Tax=Cladophialophora immunda TaxID=569365 RepID=A0A0D2DGZ3_9EURO|nr:uncharacterized protein PV07_01741 [Cladophialophora immunda]KIW35014.1 hypothetical protein PV07_01741 [Cladophialophora immunda]
MDGTSSSPVRQAVLYALPFLRAYWYLLIPLYMVLRFLVQRYNSPLRVYPGPFIASGSRIFKLVSVASGKTEKSRIDLHRKYGRVVRLGPNELSFASPQAAKEVLAAGKGFYKTDFYSVFPPPENPDIFTEIREDVHAQKKRVAAHPYSMSAMQQLTPIVARIIQKFGSKLDGFCSTPNEPFDLGDWLHFFAFDVLGEVAFSRQFGFMDAGYDVENAIKTIDDSQWYNSIVGQMPFLDHFLRRNPINRFLPGLAIKDAHITRMAWGEVQKRKPYDSGIVHTEHKDLLSSLVKGHQANPDKFSEADIFSVVHGAIFAGSDSTASTMQSFFYYVLNSKSVYSKILEEVDAAYEKAGDVSLLEWSDSQQLEYFQAALRESMRLRPGVGVDISRLVPPGGAVVDGQKYPGGTSLAFNAWVLHRDEEIFGPDVENFRPERWLDKEKAKNMDRFMFQFGGGSHLCLGKNLALLEINKVVPFLLRNYYFELVNPGVPLKHHTTFFVVQHGLIVYMKKRKF